MSITVFDWDDTLMATSHWNKTSQTYPNISANIISLINKAKTYGKVLIITNAEYGWVTDSCLDALPGIEKTLNSITVISTPFKGYNEGCSSTWKTRAFLSELPQYFTSTVKQLVCFGDSLYDREASQKIQSIYGEKITVKNIKFMESPTVEQLEKQQRLMIDCITDIYEYDGSMDLMLTIYSESKSMTQSSPVRSTPLSCSEEARSTFSGNENSESSTKTGRSVLSEENDPMFDMEF